LETISGNMVCHLSLVAGYSLNHITAPENLWYSSISIYRFIIYYWNGSIADGLFSYASIHKTDKEMAL